MERNNAHHESELMQNQGHVSSGNIDSVICGDCRQSFRLVSDDSVHLILSDIPYGIGAEEWDVLHANTNAAFLGSSPAQAKAGAVFKKRGKPINGWSEADRAIPREYQEWCASWASECYRVLKPGGSALIFAGRRFSHRAVIAFEDAGFSFKDSLAWLRRSAPHRAQRISVVYQRRGDDANAQKWAGWRVGNLRPTFEPILWLCKPYKQGGTIADNMVSHGVGAYNEDAFTGYAGAPDNVIECGLESKEGGFHPTQKPVRLMEALINLASGEGQTVLDPFAGSGSTLVAAKKLKRRYIGFEVDPEYVEVARQRLDRVEDHLF